MTTERSGRGEPRTLSDFLARPHRRIILDVGCGDARATARLAAQEPEALIVGVDANLDAAERVARRSRRAPEKGGLANLALVRAAADSLPGELEGRIDEVRIDLPWGSLLDGLLDADAAFWSGIARVMALRGVIRIVLNARALPDGLQADAAAARLRRALESAGLEEIQVGVTAIAPETGWGKRLARDGTLPVVVGEARLAPRP